MNLFEDILLSIILISFPLVVSLFFITYSKNANREENNLLFGVAIFSSTYLLLKFGTSFFTHPFVIIIDIIILISYIRDRKYEAIIISGIALLYYFSVLSISIYYLIFEYLVYYVLYLIKKKTKLNDYLFGLSVLSIKAINLYFNKTDILLIFGMLVASFIILILIITLLKKSEEILSYHMQYKELEKEKQFRTSLFKITHEIKNPLAVCKGYLDMFDTNNINHSRNYVPIIRNEVEKTLVLLKDFLSINRINIEKDIIDINLLLSDCLISLKPLLKENNVKLLFKENDDEMYIDGDYNRLNQVIINVVKNSVEAIDKNKRSYIKVYIKEYKKKIEVIFEDNGIGISTENLLKIKEPFFTTKHTGSGLGICLSFEIIKAHNGDMIYESEENKGTTVKLVLPKRSYLY